MFRLAFLKVENIFKTIDGEPILKGVSFTANKGEILVILGPSGSGKTTTLRIIAGTIFPDRGKIVINGKDMTFDPPWSRNIGFVYQNLALFPHMTVEENISFGLVMRGWSKNKIKERVDHLVDMLKLKGLENRYPNQLSGGQQQRVAIARALAPYPTVLLMDEPFSNLDALLREEFRYEFRQLVKKLGITTVFVTHDQEEAFQLADKIAVMDGGKILQTDKPENVLQKPANIKVAKFLKMNIIKIDGKYLIFSPTSVKIGVRKGVLRARVIDISFRQFFWKIILETDDGQRFNAITYKKPQDLEGDVWVSITHSRFLEG